MGRWLVSVSLWWSSKWFHDLRISRYSISKGCWLTGYFAYHYSRNREIPGCPPQKDGMINMKIIVGNSVDHWGLSVPRALKLLSGGAGYWSFQRNTQYPITNIQWSIWQANIEHRGLRAEYWKLIKHFAYLYWTNTLSCFPQSLEIVERERENHAVTPFRLTRCFPVSLLIFSKTSQFKVTDFLSGYLIINPFCFTKTKHHENKIIKSYLCMFIVCNINNAECLDH